MNRILASLLIACVVSLGACQQSSVGGEMEKLDRADAAQAAKNKAASAAYIAANKTKPGVVTLPSGLQYQVVRAGDKTLPTPALTDVVTVNYEGRLVDGTVFDSSYRRGTPAEFEVGGVIDAWKEGMQLMRPGEEYVLTVPPDIGYGAAGSPPDIPPNSALIFKVELISFKRPDGTVVKAK